MTRPARLFSPLSDQLALLQRGAEEILPQGGLEAKIQRSIKDGRPLIVKCGFDPTAPDLHLGHTVVLQKMRQFQQCGHKVVFLIGDFTGMIGDPSGRNELRKLLGKAEVKKNARTYEAQVFKILDKKKTKIDFNSRWMEKMSASDLIELATHYTVARMLERDDFHKRFEAEAPITIREFLYPIVQGYDSVALKADIELGGTDQKFNLLVAREIQKSCGQEPQVILTTPLLEGLDGVQKMSKSLGNYIGITEPANEMFGKIMSVSDNLMIRYFELLTDHTNEEIENFRTGLKTNAIHPRDLKAQLARTLVTRYHDKKKAAEAEDAFNKQFRDRKVPNEKKSVALPKKGESWPQYLRDVGLVASSSEATRLIRQGAVRCGPPDGDLKPILDPKAAILLGPGSLIKVGKRTWAKVRAK